MNTKTNKYEILENKIKCYTYKNKVFYISKESEWVLKNYYWSITSRGYVRSEARINKKKKSLHRLLMEENLTKELEVDHVDGDKLNNCLSNLRVVTRNQNQWNKKRNINYGIIRKKHITKLDNYRVRISYKGKKHYLGTCSTIEEARKVRDDWENCHERKEYFRQEV